MDKFELKGKWNQVKGTIKENWGELTNDVVDKIDGNYDQLVGKIQEKYSLTTEEAKKQVDDFLTKI